ncbi:tRNA (guanosine(37)-N1)-methyltransferase TrmD [Actinomyces bowdenii]|uniref:tRNA (guanine-N(1)-)-methyltransferase n=1 Tax=Actinomyces bowdenii TaxID=131109 RepID=A0A3P1V8Y7_9ACTO|nr:tRNA (guanosine(37)-N1)-methyltransferase TrmD [Actinomyces bowdenii]RRD29950.1 tRNA (guanosine(37)-N1)-methyltransferase TrmD [Actinomyces bowdenii]
MRIDVVTIFPDYLRALDLSLIGRAAAGGALDLAVHDLREWTTDRHRTVDDTPIGGGAGMVMKPDIWGRALDEVLAAPGPGPAGEARPRPVLIIPTPAGEVFTQRTAEELAGAQHLVLACGRYEGIDGRVARHYAQQGVEVRELSIGDYVLNGGEAAALVIIEAVARLLPGVLGNPDSVVEESHGSSGLLEYEVHTRPTAWRGLEVDPVLLSGDHARIARARRDQSIARTAARRPDLIAALDAAALDAQDRAALAAHGWVAPPGAPHPRPLTIRPARAADAAELVDLATRTFPDACPGHIPPEYIRQHVETHLTPELFSCWIEDERVGLFVAELPEGAPAAQAPVPPGRLVGYSAVIIEAPDQTGALPPGLDERPPGLPAGPDDLIAELSKVYVDAAMRGSGLAPALVEAAVAHAADRGADLVWLGTATANRRAQKAYRRSGFAVAGARDYRVGEQVCRDVVMVRRPGPAAAPTARSAGGAS